MTNVLDEESDLKEKPNEKCITEQAEFMNLIYWNIPYLSSHNEMSHFKYTFFTYSILMDD